MSSLGDIVTAAARTAARRAAKTAAGEPETLYETVADRVRGLIDAGTFGVGDRVPSVRRLAAELGVSVTTVLGAYRLLEDRRIIEARPQSGYYVRPRFAAEMPASQASLPVLTGGPATATASRPVAMGDLALRVLHDSRDPGLVPLGAAIPPADLLPTEKLNRCLSAAARRLGGRGATYEFPAGYEPLRAQIAQRCLDAGVAATPDDIVVTNGCQEAMNLAFRAVCSPGDTVAAESPGYYGAFLMLEHLGLKVIEIPCHPGTGLDVDALAAAIDRHPVKAVLVTPNHNNPTGARMPDAAKRRMVELLAERGVPLVEDDIYGTMNFEGPRPRAAKSFDREGNTILCSSFSKDLAPGFRVGFAVVPERWRKRFEQLKASTSVSTGTLPQAALADFLGNGGYDHHLRRIRREYARRVGEMLRAVGRAFPEGTRAAPPAGGFVLWVELPGRVDAMALCDRARAAGISTAPGPAFSSGGGFRHHLRLNCAHWDDTVEAAVYRLGRMVGE